MTKTVDHVPFAAALGMISASALSAYNGYVGAATATVTLLYVSARFILFVRNKGKGPVDS